MTSPVLRLLVADDQELVRAGFAMILGAQSDLEVVGEVADGAAAVAAAADLRPDVILMDVRMPVVDGLEATRQITAAHPGDDGPRVLILTTFDLDEYVHTALQAGARGFLLKDTPPAELIAGIRSVAHGDLLLGPSITQRLVQELGGRRRVGMEDRRHAVLTPKEREVLIEVAAGRSNAEIGARLFIGEATVKTHVGSCLAKLACRDRVQLVVLAYEAGLVQPGDR